MVVVLILLYYYYYNILKIQESNESYEMKQFNFKTNCREDMY